MSSAFSGGPSSKRCRSHFCQQRGVTPCGNVLLHALISNITYLDVEGDLRGEVSEGAGDDDSGALQDTAEDKA